MYPQYKACSTTEPRIHYGADSIHQTQGYQAGTVSHVAKLNVVLKTVGIRDVLKLAIAGTEAVVGHIDPGECSRVLGLLLGGVFFNYRGDVGLDFSSYRRIFPGEKIAEYLNQGNWYDTTTVQTVHHIHGAATFGRLLFKSENGQLGICPPNTQVGDEVWVIGGGNVPLILRKNVERGDRHYKFVGDCYMEGVMDGKVVEKADSSAQEVILV
jgi:hypothetical protein